MDSKAIIISLIYYIGIASCAAQGAEKGKDESRIPVLYYIANAFGGGFMRDVIFLEVHPWLFTLSALPDLTLVVIIGCLYTYCFFTCKTNKKQYGTAMQLITITDAFGLGSFICIGMDKAFVYSNNVFTIVTCGYITAIGGGILTRKKPLIEIFKSRETIRYHLITLLGCCHYYVFRHSLCLVYFIVIGLFMAHINYRTLYNPFACSLTTPYVEIFFLHPTIRNNNNNFQRRKIVKSVKRLGICPKCPKIYLIQQRIRQC